MVVVTNPDNGWDCVVAVLSDTPTNEQWDDLEARGYVLHDKTPKTTEEFLKQLS